MLCTIGTPFSLRIVVSSRNLACSGLTSRLLTTPMPDLPPYLSARILFIRILPSGSPPSPALSMIAASMLRMITTCSSSVESRNLVVINSARSRGKSKRALAVKFSAVLAASAPRRISRLSGLLEAIVPIFLKPLISAIASVRTLDFIAPVITSRASPDCAKAE